MTIFGSHMLVCAVQVLLESLGSSGLFKFGHMKFIHYKIRRVARNKTRVWKTLELEVSLDFISEVLVTCARVIGPGDTNQLLGLNTKPTPGLKIPFK